ncbi:MAG: SCO family protein [Abditibacteriaceae bacterium]
MRIRKFFKKILLCGTVIVGLMGVTSARAAALNPSFVSTNSQEDDILANVGWTQNVNQNIPLNLAFTNEQGQTVKLGTYFGSKPVILTLMYYECPMLCGEVINGTLTGLRGIKFKAGRDYQYVAVSINPNEGPKLAAEKKKVFLKKHNLIDQANGFHFLTGKEGNIQALAKAVGFRYSYDTKTKSYAHPAGIVILNSKGSIYQYMGGVIFQPNNLRLGLVASSQGEVGSLTDIILLKCCTFDPNTGTYNFAVHRILAIGGALTLLCVCSLIFTLRQHEKNRKDSFEEDIKE